MADMVRKIDALQIENIIDKVVPIIAAPEDHSFFRGILYCKADSCDSSAEFSNFIARLLAEYDRIQANSEASDNG